MAIILGGHIPEMAALVEVAQVRVMVLELDKERQPDLLRAKICSRTALVEGGPSAAEAQTVEAGHETATQVVGFMAAEIAMAVLMFFARLRLMVAAAGPGWIALVSTALL